MAFYIGCSKKSGNLDSAAKYSKPMSWCVWCNGNMLMGAQRVWRFNSRPYIHVCTTWFRPAALWKIRQSHSDLRWSNSPSSYSQSDVVFKKPIPHSNLASEARPQWAWSSSSSSTHNNHNQTEQDRCSDRVFQLQVFPAGVNIRAGKLQPSRASPKTHRAQI